MYSVFICIIFVLHVSGIEKIHINFVYFKVEIFSIMNRDGTNPPEIDVRYAASGSPYYPAEKLDGAVAEELVKVKYIHHAYIVYNFSCKKSISYEDIVLYQV